MNFYSVIIDIKSVLKKDQNHYYYNIFLEKCSYQLVKTFGKTKVAKEEFYGRKKPIKIWDVNVDNIDISKSVETKYNSKYLIGPLVFNPLIQQSAHLLKTIIQEMLPKFSK